MPSRRMDLAKESVKASEEVTKQDRDGNPYPARSCHVHGEARSSVLCRDLTFCSGFIGSILRPANIELPSGLRGRSEAVRTPLPACFFVRDKRAKTRTAPAKHRRKIVLAARSHSRYSPEKLPTRGNHSQGHLSRGHTGCVETRPCSQCGCSADLPPAGIEHPGVPSRTSASTACCALYGRRSQRLQGARLLPPRPVQQPRTSPC